MSVVEGLTQREKIMLLGVAKSKRARKVCIVHYKQLFEVLMKTSDVLLQNRLIQLIRYK